MILSIQSWFFKVKYSLLIMTCVAQHVLYHWLKLFALHAQTLTNDKTILFLF